MADHKHQPELAETNDTASDVGGRLLWGLLFIGVGVVLILESSEIVSVDMAMLWRLWPVIIVLVGISLLSLRGWVAGIVYCIAAIVIAFLGWAVVTGQIGDDITRTVETTSTLNISEQGSDLEGIDMKLEGGAGSYYIESNDSGDAIEGELRGRSAQFEHTSVVKDNRQSITIRSKSDTKWSTNAGTERMNLKIGTTLPTSLSISAGASKIEADLSDIMLESLRIDAGASSVNIKLGSPANKTKVAIDTGVSSVKFQVPKETGVRLVVDSGLSNKNLPSEYIKIDDKTYESPSYKAAEHTIDMTIDIGVSSFSLSEY